MKKNAETFLSKTLGSDFLESLGTSLSKSEVYKQGTRTITDTDDLFQGLQVVPRALLSLLVRELSPMQIGDTKEIQIPGNEDTKVITTKHERDSYSGQIIQNNVKISDFLHRSLLGLGLVLMTMLELYDLDDLDKKPSIDKSKESEINRIIDERMHLHSLVNKVVDGKMMHRDAISQLFMGKLNELYKEQQKIKEDHKEIMAPQAEPKPPVVVVLEIKKKRPLSDFIENRKKKFEKKEHHFQLEKSETVACHDCGQTIFSEGAYSGCICFGDSDKKVHIKKSEDGYNIRFGRGWDIENMEMLLEVLRSNKNG
jgi:hypothetical protein